MITLSTVRRPRIWLLPILAGCWGTISAAAAVVRVDAAATSAAPDGLTWATAFTNVQSGINASGVGDEVWVAAGWYAENLQLPGGRLVFGGFAGTETERAQRDWVRNTTIVSGGEGGSAVVVQGGSSSETRLDGLTLQNGQNTSGGGVRCEAGTSLVIANSTLRANFATETGGAVWGTNATVTVEACDVVANRAAVNGGGICVLASTLTLVDSQVRSNLTLRSGRGGGLYAGPSAESPAIPSTVTLLRNAFVSNRSSSPGGGLSCDTATAGTVASNVVAFNVSADWGAGLECYASSLAIHHNRFVGNTPTNTGFGGFGGGGLFVYSGPAPCEPQIRDNIFQGNSVSGTDQGGGGIYVAAGCAPFICNNTFVANSSGRKGGAIWNQAPAARIANNIFAYGSSGLSTTGPNAFNNCFFANVEELIAGYQPLTNNGNLNLDPKFSAQLRYGDLHLQADSPCRDAGDPTGVGADWVDWDGESHLRAGRVDIGADAIGSTIPVRVPAVIHVSLTGSDEQNGLSWANAKRSVQAGVNAAALAGGEVWVAEGTYYEWVTLRPFAYLYGGFAGQESTLDGRDWVTHPTVIDAQQKGRVVSALYLDVYSRLDGFTLRNGSSKQGGGMYCEYSSIPIANNVVVSNRSLHSTKLGPGVGSGGGLDIVGGAPLISNNLIAFNQAEQGGGVSLMTFARAVVVNNLIQSNRAESAYSGNFGGGGVAMIDCAATVANNLIHANVATNLSNKPVVGAGIACWGYSAAPAILNNTIVNNTGLNGGTAAVEYGGGLYWNAPGGAVINNLIASNSSGIYAGSSMGVVSTVPLTNNCVFGNSISNFLVLADPTGLQGNISADPLFVEPGSNYRLSPGSPCVDAGATAWAVGLTSDLDGLARVAGSNVDIGAYELGSLRPFTLTAPSAVVGGRLTLELQSEAGRSYVAEASADLVHWSPLATNVATNITLIWPDLPATDGSRQFYRAKALP